MSSKITAASAEGDDQAKAAPGSGLTTDERFPAVAGDLLTETPDCAGVFEFLARVEAWRSQLADRLSSSPGGIPPMSEALGRLLLAALGGAAVSPDALEPARLYGVAPFPAAGADASCEHAHQQALDILVWRSRLVDFLADIWDVIGPAAFEMEECGWAADQLLTPASDVKLCLDCLQPVVAAGRGQRRHTDDCLIRRRRADPSIW